MGMGNVATGTQSVGDISGGSAVAVTDIALDQTKATIKAGETLSLTASIKPENATNKEVVWSSSDESVATVDANGTVTGKKEGTATITAKTVSGGKTATCKITVKGSAVTVSLNRSEIALQKQEGYHQSSSTR